MRVVIRQRTVLWASWALLANLPTGKTVLAQAGPLQWESITQERLLHPEDGDWMSYRRSYDVTGFSPLDEINTGNVDRLQLVWAYSMRDNSRWVPTPVVANGLMYVSEGSGRVTAFDVASGDVVWIHERSYPDDIRQSEAYLRARGVALSGDRVYWGTADSHLVALDARTGEVVWDVKTGDYHFGEGHAHPPLIADGKVLLGQAGGDFGARGAFRAFNAETGELIWTFFTVPREGEPGWETWTQGPLPPLGAAPWNTISYDPELRLVYFGTGQPYPWASTLRNPGDDALYASSILALDIDSGERRWHFQLVPRDTWDRAGFESILVDLNIRGEVRKALISTGKTGWGVVLDRATGEFIHAFRTAYDNVITGWTERGRPILNPEQIPTMDDVDSERIFKACPGFHGGRDLNAAAYSPITGFYYLGLNNACMDMSFVSEEYVEPGSGRRMRGVSTRLTKAPGYEHVGEFVAFEPRTGERVWEYRAASGAAMTASALTTAGGLVFGGTADREFFALDSATGELLWKTRLNGDISGAPVTFEVGGKQYLAVGAGGRIGQTTTYGPLTGTDIPQGSGVMWVFALP